MPAVALKTLLRGRRPYAGTPGDGTIATLSDGIVSLPCDVYDAPLAVTLLAEESHSFLEVLERMKRSEVDLDVLLPETLPIQLYTCQVLQRSRRKYRALCRRLHSTDLLKFSWNPKSFVGLFLSEEEDPWISASHPGRQIDHFFDESPARSQPGRGRGFCLN